MNLNQTIKIKIALSLAFLALAFGFFAVQYAPLNISAVKVDAFIALNFLKDNPLIGTVLFIAFYFFINAVPMPLISLPTILAGYLFGTINALIIVSFTSALGASCLFLISRYLLKDWVNKRISNHSPTFERIRSNDNFWNAVSFRLLPGMPFFVPSIALSFTNISFGKFYLSTQLGLLFILFVFVNAGNHLMHINSIDDVLNTKLVISMLLLALSPFLPNLLINKFLKNEV